MTDEQKKLDDYMSELSEQAFCAAWMAGLEFALWEALLGLREEYGYVTITAARQEKLRELSDACGGWIVFEEQRGTTWIPLAEWQRRFAAGRPPFVSEIDDG